MPCPIPTLMLFILQTYHLQMSLTTDTLSNPNTNPIHTPDSISSIKQSVQRPSVSSLQSLHLYRPALHVYRPAFHLYRPATRSEDVCGGHTEDMRRTTCGSHAKDLRRTCLHSTIYRLRDCHWDYKCEGDHWEYLEGLLQDMLTINNLPVEGLLLGLLLGLLSTSGSIACRRTCVRNLTLWSRMYGDQAEDELLSNCHGRMIHCNSHHSHVGAICLSEDVIEGVLRISLRPEWYLTIIEQERGSYSRVETYGFGIVGIKVEGTSFQLMTTKSMVSTKSMCPLH